MQFKFNKVGKRETTAEALGEQPETTKTAVCDKSQGKPELVCTYFIAYAKKRGYINPTHYGIKSQLYPITLESAATQAQSLR